jgi:hypothetical protein
MAILRIPINVADRKAVSEGAALPVATGQIVKLVLERVVGITAVITREGRIAEANQ